MVPVSARVNVSVGANGSAKRIVVMRCWKIYGEWKPSRKCSRQAMAEELNDLIDNQTWTLVPLGRLPFASKFGLGLFWANNRMAQSFQVSMLDEWFSGVIEVVFRCKEAVSWLVLVKMDAFTSGILVRFIKRAVFVALTCVFVLGGVIVGIITGALKGQTTETGFCRGAAIGIVAGAITAVQLLESLVNGEPLSKVALIGSVMNGKAFLEWVSPAVLKAYQWQMNTLETRYREISDIYDTYRESSDIYDVSGIKGLPQNVLQQLPQHRFCSSQADLHCCTICLLDIKNGELARKLPICKHLFHMECIDKWLTRQGACPICREDICKSIKYT